MIYKILDIIPKANIYYLKDQLGSLKELSKDHTFHLVILWSVAVQQSLLLRLGSPQGQVSPLF